MKFFKWEQYISHLDSLKRNLVNGWLTSIYSLCYWLPVIVNLGLPHLLIMGCNVAGENLISEGTLDRSRCWNKAIVATYLSYRRQNGLAMEIVKSALRFGSCILVGKFFESFSYIIKSIMCDQSIERLYWGAESSYSPMFDTLQGNIQALWCNRISSLWT